MSRRQAIRNAPSRLCRRVVDGLYARAETLMQTVAIRQHVSVSRLAHLQIQIGLGGAFGLATHLASDI